MNSIWIDRLVLPHDDKKLKARMQHEPEPLEDLEKLPVAVAVKLLEKALEKVHWSTNQQLAIVRRLMGAAEAYARLNYPDNKAFVRNSYAMPFLYDREPATIMITSEAGQGKSEMAKAITRLLGEHPRHRASATVPELPVVGGIFLRVDRFQSYAGLMNLIAEALGISERFNKFTAESVDGLRRTAYQMGCCFILIDEIQFIAQSKDASTLIVNILTFYRSFGMPVFFAGNFSLGHKLKKRPPESRQRLLADPAILMPDPSDSNDFAERMEAYQRVTREVFTLAKADHAHLHWYTAGNKRICKDLITKAYIEARARSAIDGGKTSITIVDIRKAQASPEFSTNREEVNLYWRHVRTGESVRSDFVCPFDLPESLAVIQKKIVQTADQIAMSEVRHQSQMSHEERKGARIVEKLLAAAVHKAPKAAQRAKLPPRTSAALLASIPK